MMEPWNLHFTKAFICTRYSKDPVQDTILGPLENYHSVHTFEVLARHCEILWDTVRPRKTLQDTSRTHLNHSTTLTHGICLYVDNFATLSLGLHVLLATVGTQCNTREPRFFNVPRFHWSQPQDGGVTSELELGQHVNTHKAANQSQSQHVSTQFATNVWTSKTIEKATRNMFRHFGLSNKQRLSLSVYVLQAV